MKLPMKFRLRSSELSHFKALVMFVFAVYGILIPLWFAFHGNKLLGNDDQWQKVVVTSTRLARMANENGYFETKRKSGEKSLAHFRKEKNGLQGNRRRFKKPAMLPKPIYSFGFWPIPPDPRQKAAYISGRLLSMKWEHLCCQSINCLRKFPLFPLLPSKKRFIKKLRLPEKGRLYGQRIAGLLKPPQSGVYSIYMKCLTTCEFWLSENEYPIRSKLLKKIVRGLPVEHDLRGNNSKSLIFKVLLQTNRAYFVDVLLTVYRYSKRPFEVTWKLPRSNKFVPLTKKFFAGFQKNPESLTSVLKLYAHSPSVSLTPFLESIEEPGDDDDDYTILGGKTDLTMNSTFMDSQGRPILVNSSLQGYKSLRLFKGSPPLVECNQAPIFLINRTIGNYSGVWKTDFSSVFPGDRTGHMMCIGNRYPVDCEGNKVMSRETVSKVLTFYSKALSDSNTRALGVDNHDQNKDSKESVKLHHLVRIQEKIDTRNGSLLLVTTILKGTDTNSTYYDSRYLYMDKKHTSICLPPGFNMNFNVSVNVIVVAKRQTKWLRHFLANMEKIYVKTKDKNINVIIAKYGHDDEELMEEYKSNRLPSIRSIHHRSTFDKRRAIQSAVKKIRDENSIIFLMDLHIVVPHTIIQLARKHTIQGHMVFNPVVFRLSHCGSPASSTKPPRGFWETFGYGILGIYKSDWDKLGNTRKKYKKGWGGEDWELLDRILAAGLDVQRIRIPNFYHFHHTKKGMWN